MALETARAMLCREGTNEQQKSFGRMVTIASVEGDPAKVKPGVLWVGGLLKACDLIPDPLEVDPDAAPVP